MRIFLTGATGFLGTVLLRELISNGHTVTALSRANKTLSAADRLKHALADYDPDFQWNRCFGNSLFVVEGDTSRAMFGLDEKTFLGHATSSDMLLHNAACTALEADWKIYQEVNIGGTLEAIEFAAQTRRKEMAHVSSAYVAGERTGLIHETEADLNGGFRNNYEKSKAVSEQEVRRAASAGRIRSMFLRPSIIVGDSRTGWMCPNHHFFDFISRLLFIRGLIRNRMNSANGAEDSRFRVPGEPAATKNFVPVDSVAKLISILITKETAWGKTFHLTNPVPVKLKSLEFYVQTALDWPELKWCLSGEMQELSPLERRFSRSVKLYEKYFWQEPVFDQTQLKSVLNGDLIIPERMSQEVLNRMVGFVQAKYAALEESRREKASQDVSRV